MLDDKQMGESSEVDVIRHYLVEEFVWPIVGSNELLAVAGGLQLVDDRTVIQSMNLDGKNRVTVIFHQDLHSSIQY